MLEYYNSLNNIYSVDLLLYSILVSLAFFYILVNNLYNNISEIIKNNTIIHSKIKELYNEINKIKLKSFDIIDNNSVLQKNLDEIKNEFQIMKYKQLQNIKDIKILHSRSFDSYNPFDKIISLENDINLIKNKQILYQKDTALFKSIINDILKLKNKYDELANKII